MSARDSGVECGAVPGFVEPHTCAGQEPNGPLTVHVIRTVDEISALLPAWNALRLRHGILSAWTDPGRYLAELRATGPDVRPYVVVVGDDEGPRGLLLGRTSCCRPRWRLGYWSVPMLRVQYLDIVYGGLITDNTATVSKALAWHMLDLLRAKGAHVARVNHLPLKHALFPLLMSAGARLAGTEPHWVFAIRPGSYEDTLRVFSRRHRSELRREDRLLTEHFGGDVQLKVSDARSDLQAFISTTAAIARQTYQGGLKATFNADALWVEILTSDVAAGTFLGFWLVCQGAPIAFQVGVAYERAYLPDFVGYLPEHHPLSPGRVLHMRVLEYLCSQGFELYDHGFGDAVYKRMYGTSATDEATLYLYGRGFRPLAARLITLSETALTKAATWFLNRLGLLRYIKRKWRERLACSKEHGHD